MTPKQDPQLATPDGKPVIEFIEGVVVRPAPTIPDDRGTMCEVFSFNWGWNTEPITHVYQFSILPGVVKGWVEHHEQDDRIFVSQGLAKIVLFDNRPESPTYRRINEIYIGEQNRGLIVIPKFVFHAFQGVGLKETFCINLPTKAYNYEKPDKFRLPLKNDLIPYTFQ